MLIGNKRNNPATLQRSSVLRMSFWMSTRFMIYRNKTVEPERLRALFRFAAFSSPSRFYIHDSIQTTSTEALELTEPERLRFLLKIFRFYRVIFTKHTFTRRLSNMPQTIDKPIYISIIAPGSMVFIPGANKECIKSKQ